MPFVTCNYSPDSTLVLSLSLNRTSMITIIIIMIHRIPQICAFKFPFHSIYRRHVATGTLQPAKPQVYMSEKKPGEHDKDCT